MIPKLINQDRVLYLDSDIILNGSLSDFYYSDLEGAPVGVIRDYCTMQTFPFLIWTNLFRESILIVVYYLLIVLNGEMKE